GAGRQGAEDDMGDLPRRVGPAHAHRGLPGAARVMATSGTRGSRRRGARRSRPPATAGPARPSRRTCGDRRPRRPARPPWRTRVALVPMQVDGEAGELLAAGREAMQEAAFRTGDYGEAEPLLRGALARAEAAGDRSTEAAALDQLGWLMHFQALDGNREEADSDAEEALFQRSLAIRRELGDQAGVAAALFGIGLVHQVLRRDAAAAIPFLQEALALAED